MDPGQDEGRWGLVPGAPLAGLVLNAEEVVVWKTVCAREVVVFDRSSSVPHHHVEEGDRPTEGRQGRNQGPCHQALGRGFPIHQHPIVGITYEFTLSPWFPLTLQLDRS